MHALKKRVHVGVVTRLQVVIGVVLLVSGVRWCAAAGVEKDEERVVATLGGYEVFESTLGEENEFRALRTKKQESTTPEAVEKLQDEDEDEDDEGGASTGGILGGVFTSGIARGESVFAAFHVHEAVRLVARDEVRPVMTALQVGLGIGVVPTALKRHGIVVDAVEIDADVLEAARLYFGYRAAAHTTTGDGDSDEETMAVTHGRDYVEDGAQFLQRGCEGSPDATPTGWSAPYDFVIHDVWNGDFLSSSTTSAWGEEENDDTDDALDDSGDDTTSSSSSLYMLETFEAAACVMKDDGVFVLNYYGFAHALDFAAVVTTLAHVFPNLRAFHDGNRDNVSGAPYNIAVFGRRDGHALVFRDPHADDLLGSESVRYDALYHLLEREISLPIPSSKTFASDTTAGDADHDAVPVLRASHNGAQILWKLQRHVRDAHRREVLHHNHNHHNHDRDEL